MTGFGKMPEHRIVLDEMFRFATEKQTNKQMAAALNEYGFVTLQGRQWTSTR